MSRYVLITGDLALFQTSFGEATVAVRPGTLSGSGPGTVGGKAICVAGDEGNVRVEGCVYTTPIFTIPGVGALTISGLADDQTAKTGKTGSTAFLLQGSAFKAAFEVTTAAKYQPPPPAAPVSDTMTQYAGSGNFSTTNAILQAG